MFEPGRILIDPKPEALAHAVREAEARINGRLAEGPYLAVPADDLARLPRAIAAEPEGWRDWAQRGTGWRLRTLAELTVVWWADHLGRKHVGLLEAPGPRRVWPPGPSRPPLACLYPEACAERRRFGRSRLVAVCGCGAWGEPSALGWMGPCCGPCFDRGPGEDAPRRSWKLGSAPRLLALSPDGRQLAAWEEAGEVSLWDASPPGELCRWEDQGEVVSLAFNPTGQNLGWASPERTRVDLRDLARGKRVTGELALFAFHPSANSAFLYTPPDALVLWDVEEERRLVQFVVPFDLGLSDLSCSPDGRLLAGVTPNQGLFFWDAQTGEPEARFDLPRVYAPRVAWSPDSGALAIGGGRGVFLWDVPAGRVLDRLALSGELVAMAFHPDGTRLLTCSGAMQAWPARGGADLGELTFPGAEASSFALSADGGTMALGSRDGVVRLLPAEVVWAE